ncbi:MAG: leucyl aminopeptidase family protein [Actinomycetota bacterium]
MQESRVRVIPGRLSDAISAAKVGADGVDVALLVRSALCQRAVDDDTEMFRGVDFPQDYQRLCRFLKLDLDAVMAREKVRGSEGELVRVPWSPPRNEGVAAWVSGVGRVWLVGVGDGRPDGLRLAGAALARASRGRRQVLISVMGAGRVGASGIQALVEGIRLGSYGPPRRGVSSGPKNPVRQVDLVGAVSEDAVAKGLRFANATTLVRDLAHTPASVKTPAWLASQARRRATAAGLAVRVLDHRQLARESFGGLLAVGAGAVAPPRLVQLSYAPPHAVGPRIVFVGKGITFDTGGLSLKPREAMVSMKTDMTGAGVVLAVLLGCAQLGLPVQVTGLMALAENAISGSSYRPGDVLSMYDGQSVEVRNTDAEGRLVLADALAYADAMLDPDIMIDIATLTGAATAGLGRGHAALFSDDSRLITGLRRAGQASGEQVWPLPLAADYESALRSDVADVCHVATDGNKAGAITAALFLRRFIGARRWAHLDIAGPARSDKDVGWSCRGGTGFGARLLLAWLAARPR